MSDDPVKYDPQRTTHPGPLTPQSLRQALLDECGFDKPYQIKLLKKTIESVEGSLDAMKQTPITRDGEIITVHIQPDHAARAKAREQVLDLIGVNAPITHGEKSTVPVPIELPPWIKSVTKTVTVTQAMTTEPVLTVEAAVIPSSGANEPPPNPSSDTHA